LKPIVLSLCGGPAKADAGTVSAGPAQALTHINNTQVGLLATVLTGVGAIANCWQLATAPSGFACCG
jgi:hypothetical protein